MVIESCETIKQKTIFFNVNYWLLCEVILFQQSSSCHRRLTRRIFVEEFRFCLLGTNCLVLCFEANTISQQILQLIWQRKHRNEEELTWKQWPTEASKFHLRLEISAPESMFDDCLKFVSSMLHIFTMGSSTFWQRNLYQSVRKHEFAAKDLWW